MSTKISVSLRKGGSGKTTTAVNLAAALQQKNKRVLLVDLDPQANATLSVGIDPLSIKKHLNTLLTDINTHPEDIIIKTSFGLSIIPSHPDLAAAEAGMKATQVGIVKEILQSIESEYDFIIIDTPPSESYLTVNAFVASDAIIIPLQAHYLAMKGLEDMMHEINEVKKGLNPLLKIAGILPTMVSPRTNIAKTILEAVHESYTALVYPFQIEFSIKHSEASLAGLPIVIYDPSHQGSIVYNKLAETFL